MLRILHLIANHLLYQTTPSSTMLQHAEIRGTLWVTSAYMMLYYVLLFSQSFLKIHLHSQAQARGDKKASLLHHKYFRCCRLPARDVYLWLPCSTKKNWFKTKKMSRNVPVLLSNDPRAINADRAVGNMLEQMGPFLCSLWLHALLVDSWGATFWGFAYVALRAAYSATIWAAGYCRALWITTFPMYWIIAYLFCAVLREHGF